MDVPYKCSLSLINKLQLTKLDIPHLLIQIVQQLNQISEWTVNHCQKNSTMCTTKRNSYCTIQNNSKKAKTSDLLEENLNSSNPDLKNIASILTTRIEQSEQQQFSKIASELGSAQSSLRYEMEDRIQGFEQNFMRCIDKITTLQNEEVAKTREIQNKLQKLSEEVTKHDVFIQQHYHSQVNEIIRELRLSFSSMNQRVESIEYLMTTGINEKISDFDANMNVVKENQFRLQKQLDNLKADLRSFSAQTNSKIIKQFKILNERLKKSEDRTAAESYEPFKLEVKSSQRQIRPSSAPPRRKDPTEDSLSASSAKTGNDTRIHGFEVNRFDNTACAQSTHSSARMNMTNTTQSINRRNVSLSAASIQHSISVSSAISPNANITKQNFISEAPNSRTCSDNRPRSARFSLKMKDNIAPLRPKANHRPSSAKNEQTIEKVLEARKKMA